MRKKARNVRVDKIFLNARKKLPHAYVDELLKLLPELDRRKIIYAQEKRCKDLDLKRKVLEAMAQLVLNTEKSKASLLDMVV